MLALLLSTFMFWGVVPPTMHVNDVQPGQRGECLTVFESDKIETFAFVVKDLMPNFMGPGKDLILVRLEGDKVEFTGVVAGMSGSPCSIQGRLIGALSYAFAQFAKEPIAGITPIANMLAIKQLPQEPKPWRLSPTAFENDWNRFRQGHASAAYIKTQNVQKIATPLSMGGISSRVMTYFLPWFESMGMIPVPSGQSRPVAVPRPLRPGSAVAAVLVSGDVDIAATGTVTLVDEKKVFAFGHPFLGAGAVSFPMANAYILNTMVSSMRSFKMSTTGAMVGEVTQDRITAIVGHLGVAPAMVMVQGTVVSPKGRDSFQFQVARDNALTPRFLVMGLANALMNRIEASDRGTLRMSGQILSAGLPTLDIQDVYATEFNRSFFITAALDLVQRFLFLWDNPFQVPPAMSIRIHVEHDPKPKQEWIEAIQVDSRKLKPKQNLEVSVRLRRMLGVSSIEKFIVPIPMTWAGQTVELVAAGVSESEKLEQKIVGKRFPQTLEQVHRYLSERRSGGKLFLLAIRKGNGVLRGVDMHAFLPPSQVALLASDHQSKRKTQAIAWEEFRLRPGTVSGEARTQIKIRSY